MTRANRKHGVLIDAQRDELTTRLELMEAELELAIGEIDRMTGALRQIANAESGVWGQIARDALHPPAGRLDL